MIIKLENNIRVLIADDGKCINQGDIYAKEVYLAYNDSPDNWIEVDDFDVPEGEFVV